MFEWNVFCSTLWLTRTFNSRRNVKVVWLGWYYHQTAYGILKIGYGGILSMRMRELFEWVVRSRHDIVVERGGKPSLKNQLLANRGKSINYWAETNADMLGTPRILPRIFDRNYESYHLSISVGIKAIEPVHQELFALINKASIYLACILRVFYHL